jgi:hypothetical protein
MRIAEYIEKTYPDRPFTTAALLAEQEAHIDAIRKNVAGQFCALVVPGAVKNFDEPSVGYYNSTRSGIFGIVQILYLQSVIFHTSTLRCIRSQGMGRSIQPPPALGTGERGLGRTRQVHRRSPAQRDFDLYPGQGAGLRRFSLGGLLPVDGEGGT